MYKIMKIKETFLLMHHNNVEIFIEIVNNVSH
jgi:hypothetical protein